MNTLLLAQNTWDLVLDINGNIAVASDPYSQAQDVASAVRLFLGELYYNTIPGVPYYNGILGVAPNLSFIRAQVETAALTVPGIAQARCVFASFVGRTLRGQVQVINTAGVQNNVSF